MAKTAKRQRVKLERVGRHYTITRGNAIICEMDVPQGQSVYGAVWDSMLERAREECSSSGYKTFDVIESHG